MNAPGRSVPATAGGGWRKHAELHFRLPERGIGGDEDEVTGERDLKTTARHWPRIAIRRYGHSIMRSNRRCKPFEHRRAFFGKCSSTLAPKLGR